MPLPPPITHEIETPLPLQSRGGRVRIAGWLVLEPDVARPEVRFRVGESVVGRTQWLPRVDVARSHPGHAGAANAGFVLEGELPSGVHQGWLEASSAEPTGAGPNNSAGWRAIRPLSIAVFPSALRAVIERPVEDTIVADDVRPEGWCFHPDHDLTAVFLRYGNREIACEIGRPRPDAAALFPNNPRAARSGFLAPGNLPHGRGPLWFKAVAADGQVFFLRTGREVSIPAPVTADGAIYASEGAIDGDLLPPSPRRAAPQLRSDGGAPLRVLFVLYGDFTSNSALHVAGLANQLCAAGHEVVVAVPRDPQTLERLHAPAFRAVAFADVPADTGLFRAGARADIVHAWTPRENVRRFLASLVPAPTARVVVHLEDHEDVLSAAALEVSVDQLRALDDAALARLPDAASHPRRAREFLGCADGITVVVETLRAWAKPGQAVQVIRPAADERCFFPRPRNEAMRAALQLPAEAFLLAYPGNVHAANAAEVRELYVAVGLLAARGVPVWLLRTGRDFVDFAADLPEARQRVLELGHVMHGHHLPEILALADALVQPGEPGLFNDYRLPSKLPEFFAIGRPVILPRTNLGLEVRDGIDALVLPRADASSIADAVQRLARDAVLARRLGEGAASFAAKHFSWARSAEQLVAFYRATLAR